MRKKKLATIAPVVILSLIVFAQSAFAAYTMNRSTWPTLSSGSTGGFVQALQADLWSSGLSSTVGTIDGSFGSNTKSSVESFQDTNGLTIDGSVGPLTRAKFASYETVLAPTQRVYRNPGSNTYETYYSLIPDGAGGEYYNYYLRYKSGGSLVKNGTVYYQ